MSQNSPNLTVFLAKEAYKQENLAILVLAMEEHRINPSLEGEVELNWVLTTPFRASESPASAALSALEELAYIGKGPMGTHYKPIGMLISFTLAAMQQEKAPNTYWQRMRTCIERINL